MYFHISKLLNSSTNNLPAASQLSGSASNGGKEETGTKSWPRRNTSLPCVRGYRKHECMSHVSMSAQLFSRLSFSCTPEQEGGEELREDRIAGTLVSVCSSLRMVFRITSIFLVFFCPNIVTVCIVTAADYHPKRYRNYFFVLDSPDCRGFSRILKYDGFIRRS